MKRFTFLRLMVHWWRQNLKKEDSTKHWWYQRGRWWLYRMPEEQNVGSFGWSLAIPGHHPGVQFGATPQDDEPFQFHLGLGLFDLWLDADSKSLRRLCNRLTPVHKGYSFHDSREISLRFFGGAVWWTVWMDQDESSSTDPKWRRGSWHPLDTFFGRHKYNEQALGRQQAIIHMPEGEYSATVELFMSTWKRPRWPWAKSVQRATIAVENPPQFAGKGENSWDMDDDAIYEMTMPATTIAEAVAAYTATVLRNRERYGLPESMRV
jgi:hypothetical protein